MYNAANTASSHSPAQRHAPAAGNLFIHKPEKEQLVSPMRQQMKIAIQLNKSDKVLELWHRLPESSEDEKQYKLGILFENTVIDRHTVWEKLVHSDMYDALYYIKEDVDRLCYELDFIPPSGIKKIMPMDMNILKALAYAG